MIFRIILFYCFLICFAIHSFCQNTGYLGKKFLLKTNLANGRDLPANTIDFEYVISRHVSINLGLQFNKFDIGKLKYEIESGTIKPRNQIASVTEVTAINSGNTATKILIIGSKFYFNKIMPAPYGFYTQVNLGLGMATFKEYSFTYHYKRNTSDFYLNESEVKGYASARPTLTDVSGEAPVFVFDIPSIGYQRIFNTRFAIDAQISLQGQYCKLPENIYYALEKNYYMRSNLFSKVNGGLAIGPSISVKLGLLLF